jgi:hypothetical protein
MNMRAIHLVCGAATLAVAVSTSAQVVIHGTETSNQSGSSSASTAAVTINTGDRDVVPLIKDTKDNKVDPSTERTESITRARLNDGTYFDWLHTSTVKKEVSPGRTISSSDVVESDRQGQSHVSEHSDETVSKSATGDTSEKRTYTRNSSGQLVLSQMVDADTTKTGPGATSTTRVEKSVDANGNLVLKQQVEEVTVDHGPNQKVVTSQIKTVDHLNGQLAVSAQETTSITTQGSTKQTDSVVRTPGVNGGWQASGRTTTTETTAPDGSVKSETIEQGPAAYTTKAGDDISGSIVPQRKIVETEVRKPDGTTVVQRDVFQRDVNGDWTPQSFSTKEADKGYSAVVPVP